MADIASNIQSIVATDCARSRGKGVGGAEEGYVEVNKRQYKNDVAYVPRPVFTASRPSQTIAQIGPLPMSKFIRDIEWKDRVMHTLDESWEERLGGEILV